MKKYKVLNLFAGAGGNRAAWNDCEVTAVEFDLDLCNFYKSRFPNDNVVQGCAYDYLLNHFKEFDFIWASPPCQTHSKAFHARKGYIDHEYKYPDLRLYEVILFLKNHFAGKWVVENVQAYYAPVREPYNIGRHWYWTNFNLKNKVKVRLLDCGIGNGNNELCNLEKFHGLSMKSYKGKIRRLQVLRNMVDSTVAVQIYHIARDIELNSSAVQYGLFTDH